MPTSHTPARLSRLEKATISRELHALLSARAQTGPAEPALDAFIPELDLVALRLDAHVGGKITARAVRVASGCRVEEADAIVDTWTRQIESFLLIAGRHRRSPHAPAARALHQAAFPHGIAFIDDRVPDENAKVRAALKALAAPEHVETLMHLSFPMAWLDTLEAALAESDAAFAEKNSAHGRIDEHVSLGKDTEAQWLDVVLRLRKYIDYRAATADANKRVECQALIAPLRDALDRAKAAAESRATRRAKKHAPKHEPEAGADRP
ncbi:hypothetical protein [Polyangium sp. 6x1]|uniref:hypothetical protein n=1 Tax=Polyangium sp. 6x1 TaxID=3042689 RepID=UPI002482A282|nr:hypothetical protein [Polyangium sp. 6x1]MDI1443926.1 hypothetical protein [Polyangium sp. 6x1]